MYACMYVCGVIALYTDSSTIKIKLVTYICLSIFLAKALNKYMNYENVCMYL